MTDSVMDDARTEGTTTGTPPQPAVIRLHERRRRTGEEVYLQGRGWRLIQRVRTKFGMVYYWDHDQHQKDDGQWWTQTAAIRYQRALDKIGGVVSAAPRRP